MNAAEEMRPKRLRDIAAAIDVHIKRFAADPVISKGKTPGTLRYWRPCAYQTGRYVGVAFVGFQGPIMLTRTQAEKYLAFLDGGGIGKLQKAGVYD